MPSYAQRTRGDLNRQGLVALGQLLPKRLPGEPLLKWLPRCQAAAVDAALLLAAYEDPALDITKTTTGWEVLHKNTGQRIAITTTQEVADSA